MPTTIAPQDRVAVALDVPTLDEAADLAAGLEGVVSWFKVGLELFAAHGPEAVARIRPYGRVFLDVKLHDIPTTVERAAARLANLDIDLVTIHALGGPDMIRAAISGLGDARKVLAVTLLTSMDAGALDAVGLDGDADRVPLLAKMATGAGAGGVVCSGGQSWRVREAVGQRPMIVTPGIRPADHADDDHAGAWTPQAAIDAGSDLLVIGRPVTRSADPVAAAAAIVSSIGG